MPLMLFIFGRFLVDIRSLRIPYHIIAAQLCYIAVPVLLGMLVKWRKPQIGQILVRLLRPLSFFFIATIIGFGVYTNLQIYRLLGIYPILIPTATSLPWIGFLLAGFFALDIISSALFRAVNSSANGDLIYSIVMLILAVICYVGSVWFIENKLEVYN